MGTHPIFESDFDCLTDGVLGEKHTNREKRNRQYPDAAYSPLIALFKCYI